MKTIMNEKDLRTVSQLTEFLSGTQSVAFITLCDKDESYRWIAKTLDRFLYHVLCKKDKGIVIRYVMKISGYSRQQLTRLIHQHRNTGTLRRKQQTTRGFQRIYESDDVRLLAKMDELHQTPSGAAVKKLCERADRLFNAKEYERLSGISVSHLYNLRNSRSYVNLRRNFEKTRPKTISIGERRKPQPEGKPGYIRIDTVHQGDLDKQKGVYHINAVDEETQYEVVCTVERITEEFLLPVLKQILDSFPFVVLGFHSDNGSEYVNGKVVALLKTLLIDFTKSRSRKSNDNALVESKNGSVVRKTFGYCHIAKQWAATINQFNREFLVPYINYHRPCYFPKTIVDTKGKQRKTYPYEMMMTPYEKLKSLENAETFLKPGVTFEILDKTAYAMNDNQAA
ncbi:MAG: transposase family protein, partial [Nitrospinae bacterium]|nr:transposase family protein [Nitrospinota bacterium]